MGGLLDRHSLEGLYKAGRLCLQETYVGLAQGVPGTEVERTPSYTLCLGPTEVRFANFACSFSFSGQEEIEALVRKIQASPQGGPGSPISFMVCPGDSPQDVGRSIFMLGYTGIYTLNHLAWAPGSSRRASDLNWSEATNLRTRRKAASFMTSQFFSHRKKKDQKVMEEATVQSPHRIFLTTELLGRTTGGVMISRTPLGLGLYNVCVREDLRGQGLGARLVARAQAMAEELDLPLFLQSADDLAPWYKSLGFEQLGHVHSYYQESGLVL